MSITKYWKGRKFEVESKAKIQTIRKLIYAWISVEIYTLLELKYERRLILLNFYSSNWKWPGQNTGNVKGKWNLCSKSIKKHGLCLWEFRTSEQGTQNWVCSVPSLPWWGSRLSRSYIPSWWKANVPLCDLFDCSHLQGSLEEDEAGWRQESADSHVLCCEF